VRWVSVAGSSTWRHRITATGGCTSPRGHPVYGSLLPATDNESSVEPEPASVDSTGEDVERSKSSADPSSSMLTTLAAALTLCGIPRAIRKRRQHNLNITLRLAAAPALRVLVNTGMLRRRY
jgi:hypothetical protein